MDKKDFENFCKKEGEDLGLAIIKELGTFQYPSTNFQLYIKDLIIRYEWHRKGRRQNG